jgi:choline dehydrogenase-like flavoprotein
MGRSRLAVLVQDRGDRLGCDRSGLCLWGCSREAIYSARHDLAALKRHPNLEHARGFVVRQLARSGEFWSIRGVDRRGGAPRDCLAKTVVLAAGAIATTAIALRTMDMFDRPLRLLSSPTAAFVVVLPERIGREATIGQNLAQLSMKLGGLSPFGPVHCTLFAATQIPTYEFVRHFPLSRALAIDFWRVVAPAAIAGNCFLPGEHSAHSLALQRDGAVTVRGGSGAALKPALKALHRSLARTFCSLGAIMPPGGFLTGALGSDIHYAGTLPMVREPRPLTTSPVGELAGLSGVFVADAACLPSLPAKPHTLAMMANAHRIGTNIAGGFV